jgi:peptide deformylase
MTMKRGIITFENDVRDILSRPAKPVPEHENCRAIVDYMFEAMAYPMGVGLAAPQIGIDKRIIVIKVPHSKGGVLLGGATKAAIINPVLTWHSEGMVLGPEGCLSFPGERVIVPRYARVKVNGFSLRWEPIVIGGKDLVARVLQHELDHLEGRTLDTYKKLMEEEDRKSGIVRTAEGDDASPVTEG